MLLYLFAKGEGESSLKLFNVSRSRKQYFVNIYASTRIFSPEVRTRCSPPCRPWPGALSPARRWPTVCREKKVCSRDSTKIAFFSSRKSFQKLTHLKKLYVNKTFTRKFVSALVTACEAPFRKRDTSKIY